ncbi:uncharacterized protein KY384_004410 [Bacidia gigantensis]|uniref:uncharacterized protein n=1 Tax=Bacidia gigantensis TaxID=2732470 RepID=UPI001D04B282|nr:uncharacterized protein KY384_004410 [Bacidia gigantensis]KAG8531053.1 hypothetical protein KY384_004410 [Bacidia gigantensis]
MDQSEQSSSITKILSPGSVSGTPRSSGEFYNMSNNSTETLASEYVSPETSQMLKPPVHSRQTSSLGPMRIPKAEKLMMGYVQITGSFTLDGSLVNQSPFEEVKRKAIVGGQGGGGLVRTQSKKRDSGILSSMGWWSLGETFGGLLGDNGMSSIKDAKKTTSTKSIPILSAPQSILFVDLQLGPGESKSYEFSHPLPRGIPPSHRGKAIKTIYNIVIGTQRTSTAAQHNKVQRVEVPFRILSSINGAGDVLGHDLMTPHVLLSNSATVISLGNSQANVKSANGSLSKAPTDSNDFMSYIDKLLEHSDRDDGAGLQSPTEDETKTLVSLRSLPTSMKESIDFAILNNNSGPSAKRNVNRFEITRSGQKVAVIMLSRPAYRLGETIPVVIDFQHADIACYTLRATLETSETVDPTIALRSKASIQRYTRRIHASHHESTISSQRVVFNPMIPTTATPEFITTGVNLEWCLRFEFVTERSDTLDNLGQDTNELMEEVARDERGTVKAAVQGLYCESFDVAVPLRVYGATAALDEKSDAGPFAI